MNYNYFLTCPRKYYYKYVCNEKITNNVKIDNLFLKIFILNVLKNKDINLAYTNTINILKDIVLDENNNLKPCYESILFYKQIENLKTKTNVYLPIYDVAKILYSAIEKHLCDLTLNFTDEFISYTKDNNTYLLDISFSQKNNYNSLINQYLYYLKYNIEPIIHNVIINYNNKNEVTYELHDDFIEFNLSKIDVVKEIVDNIHKCIDNKIFLLNEHSYLCSPDYCEFYNKCKKIVT